MHPLYELFQQVKDEKSFSEFLTELRKDCEWHERHCDRRDPMQCAEGYHFEAHSTSDFLKSMEEWSQGDFAGGHHGGEPILRRVATMLYVGRMRTRSQPDADERD